MTYLGSHICTTFVIDGLDLTGNWRLRICSLFVHHADMSANHNPKTLIDLCKYDADLLIVCKKCKRKGIFQVTPIIAHFQSRGWSMVWATLLAASDAEVAAMIQDAAVRKCRPKWRRG